MWLPLDAARVVDHQAPVLAVCVLRSSQSLGWQLWPIIKVHPRTVGLH